MNVSSFENERGCGVLDTKAVNDNDNFLKCVDADASVHVHLKSVGGGRGG